MDTSQNEQQELASSLGDTKVDTHTQGAEPDSEFTRSVTPSENYIHDSYDQVRTSFDNGDDNAEMQAYILAVGTVKRDLAGESKFTPSQASHKRLLDEHIKVIDGIDRLSILVDLHIEHEVLLRDGFSQVQPWGHIHYFYVKVIGSQSIAYGVAALLGAMFDQSAIGIYHPFTKDDRRILNSNPDQPLPDNFHRYFTVYSASPISRDTTLKIMEKACERFPELSGQLDMSGQSVEFHDFGSSFKGTCAQIEEALKENFQQTFRAKTEFSKSSLLEKDDYQQALNESGLKISHSRQKETSSQIFHLF